MEKEVQNSEIIIKNLMQQIMECLEGESYINARAALKRADGVLEQHTLVTKKNLIPQLSDNFYYKEVPPEKYSWRWWWYFIILPIVIAFSVSCLAGIIRFLLQH